MDFLDHCERAAEFARREAELRRRRAEAEADGLCPRAIDEELEGVVFEKCVALLHALDWQAPADTAEPSEPASFRPSRDPDGPAANRPPARDAFPADP